MSRWPLLLLLFVGVAAGAQDDARDEDGWDDDAWGDDDWEEESAGWAPLTGFVEAAGDLVSDIERSCRGERPIGKNAGKCAALKQKGQAGRHRVA